MGQGLSEIEQFRTAVVRIRIGFCSRITETGSRQLGSGFVHCAAPSLGGLPLRRMIRSTVLMRIRLRQLRQPVKMNRQHCRACHSRSTAKVVPAEHRDPLATSAQPPPLISNISSFVSVCIFFLRVELASLARRTSRTTGNALKRRDFFVRNIG
jgi:hypothetical protein